MEWLWVLLGCKRFNESVHNILAFGAALTFVISFAAVLAFIGALAASTFGIPLVMEWLFFFWAVALFIHLLCDCYNDEVAPARALDPDLDRTLAGTGTLSRTLDFFFDLELAFARVRALVHAFVIFFIHGFIRIFYIACPMKLISHLDTSFNRALSRALARICTTTRALPLDPKVGSSPVLVFIFLPILSTFRALAAGLIWVRKRRYDHSLKASSTSQGQAKPSKHADLVKLLSYLVPTYVFDRQIEPVYWDNLEELGKTKANLHALHGIAAYYWTVVWKHLASWSGISTKGGS